MGIVASSTWSDSVDTKAAVKRSWLDTSGLEQKPTTVKGFRRLPSPEGWSTYRPRLRIRGDLIKHSPRRYSSSSFITADLDRLIERTSSHDLIFTSDTFQLFYTKEEVRRTFRKSADEWIRDTEATSSTSDMVLHPAYQRIIGLGRPALPLLLEELQARPDYWFWALRSIAGEDPNKANPSFDDAVGAWLRWGREHKYLA